MKYCQKKRKQKKDLGILVQALSFFSQFIERLVRQQKNVICFQSCILLDIHAF